MVRTSRAARLGAAILILTGALSCPVAAQPAEGASLVSRLRQLVNDSPVGEHVGVAVIDVETGRPVFQYHAERPMNPASNQKLVTAYAALQALGPQFTMRTAVHGNTEGDAVVGGLSLRGFGAPDLTYGRLAELARAVRDRGVRRVDRVIVDATYFDDQILPAAFDQQPNEVAAFRAPVSAVAVNRNAYVLRVLPGDAVGDPAHVRLLGADYFDLTNRITTAEPGQLNVIADQRGAGERMTLRLSGRVPLGIRGVSYRRRIENPLPWAGHVFREALIAEGVRVSGGVSVGSTPSGAPLLTSIESAPVAQLIHSLGKWSDNFVAEMLFKVMGAEAHRPGRGEDGVRVVRSQLEAAGVDLDGLTIVNGSGLFEGNRIAPQQLATLLRHAYRDPAIRTEYISSLAVGGVDGTLRRRMRDLPAPRCVRAKTGTLAAVIGLSGYVLGPEPERAYAFSFLANDVRGQQHASRQLADAIATELANHLYR